MSDTQPQKSLSWLLNLIIERLEDPSSGWAGALPVAEVRQAFKAACSGAFTSEPSSPFRWGSEAHTTYFSSPEHLVLFILGLCQHCLENSRSGNADTGVYAPVKAAPRKLPQRKERVVEQGSWRGKGGVRRAHVTVRVDADLRKRLEGFNISAVVEAALRKWLEGKGF